MKSKEQTNFKKQEPPLRQVDAIVSITVIIFPDGTVHFFETQPVFKNQLNRNIEYINKCQKIWCERNHDKYIGIDDFDLMGVIANIRMLQSDYYKLQATDEFIEGY